MVISIHNLKPNTMEELIYSNSNQVDYIEFNGSKFEVKHYADFVFAKDDLLNTLMDDGLPISDEASYIDEKIAQYFDPTEFDGKTGLELYNEYLSDFITFK